MKKTKTLAEQVRPLLKPLRTEVVTKVTCRPSREGMYAAVLRASFARIHEYVEFVYANSSDVGPGSFFGAAPLRQCCEDLIALKYLAMLRRKDRDNVIQSLMVISTGKAAEKQGKFFNKNHPYQPILTKTFDAARMGKAKDVLNEIGSRTGLWRTENKLPPVEQMAIKVGLSELYEYLYAATSEIVHFNVRIALRSGWGDMKTFTFSPSHFAKFYGQFSRVYSAYIWFSFCREFRSALKLSPEFLQAVDGVELAIESVTRWPELVTFEEMNIPQNDNIILRALLAIKQEERVEKLRSKHVKRKTRSSARGAA